MALTEGTPAYGWAAFDKASPLKAFQFFRRTPRPDDVTFKVKYCGICHSDLHQIHDDWGSAVFPMVPGHEITGIVSAVGADVKKFKVGDRVGVGCVLNSCRECENCQGGLENYCHKKMIWSYNDYDFYIDNKLTYGGYSNVMIASERYVLQIPDAVPLDIAAPLLCAGITVYSPMKYYGLEQGGKNFGVVGLGGLGHVAAKIAKAFGKHVTVISRSATKEKEAFEHLNADSFLVSTDKKQMEAAAKSLDFIIDTVAAKHDVNEYLQLLKVNGKLINIGLPAGSIEVSPFVIANSRLTLGGSMVGGIAETQEVLDFCGEHNITCEIETIPIDYVNTAMERLKKGEVKYRFVIDIEGSLKPPVSPL
uniref:Cinnamyl alcohol dehydrogenase 2 n=1 Tax=Haplomitrium mnioides TaxID=56921 RepID=A0AAU6NEH2_9MARC